MAIQFRALTGPSGGSSTSYTVARPSDTAGDLVLLFGGSINARTFNDPDGFTFVPNTRITGTNNIQVYVRTVAANEADLYPSGYTLSHTGTNNSGNVVAVALYSDSSQTLAVGDSDSLETTGGIADKWPSVTVAAAAFLACFATRSSNLAAAPGTDFDERLDVLNNSRRLYIQTKPLASGGTHGPFGVNSATTDTWRSASVAVIEQESLPPTGPSSLSATAASPTQINLSWTDNSSNETGFEIQQSPDNSSWSLIHTTAANATSYNVTGLDEYTLYYFRVRAVNDAGESAYTTAANARTHIIAPTSLAATTIDHQSIALTWDDNSGGEDGYKVEQSPDGSDWTQIHTTAADAISYNVTGLSPNTEYYFRVRAFVSSDNSAYSNTDNALTDLAPLVAPTDLVAAPVLSDKIRLTWADANADEDSFDIGRSPNGTTGWAIIDTATDTTYDDDGLSPETTYHYRVRAVRGAESSGWSNVANATTYAALTEPYDLITTVAGARQVNLSWDSDDTDRSGFVIESSTDGENWTEVGETPSTSFQVTGLDPETTYIFRVRSYREAA